MKEKTKLSCTVCGITFENPFILASAPPTASISSIKKAFNLGWAGAVLKTISPDCIKIKDVSPRFETLKIDKKIVGFAAINTVQSMMGIDLETLQPKPCVNGYSTFGGYSGQGIRPIGLRCVAQIAKKTDKPILGMGGISSWEDAVQYIAVGADIVQVCTEVMINGYGVITPWLKGLEKYLDEHNINNISELKGKALKFLTSHEALDKEQRKNACIDYAKCKKCKKCVMICEESGYQAIKMVNDIPEINIKKCDGCSLCQHVCPYQAIKMV